MGSVQLKEYLPGVLNLVTGAIVIALSLFVNLRFPLARESARVLGIFLVYGGMGLVLWATYHIRGAILGEVEPRTDMLVQQGPYRFVRHPVYLGMTIGMLGLTIAARSWLGMVCVFLLFLPSEIYRARLEEWALLRRFGGEWEDYAARTGFFLPQISAGESGRA